MKLITAYIQPEKLNAVKQELYKAKVFKISVTNALGCGQQRGFHESYRGVDIEVNLLKKSRLEIAVNDDFVQPTVDAIVVGARSGKIGDGKILVTDLQQCVRIRTGEHLASNGILPPANDVFSYTAAERPWVNLGWLFDLVIAGLHGLGGASVLTLFAAVVGGATFYILHSITRDDLPTWWTSVCVGIALLMANLQFTVLPHPE